MYQPGDRFYAFLVQADGRWRRHVVVARINPEADRLPGALADPEVLDILLVTRPLSTYDRGSAAKLGDTFERAERVTEKLNNMKLSVQAADLDGSLQTLFDELWVNINREIGARK
jgi:hypothetical protein